MPPTGPQRLAILPCTFTDTANVEPHDRQHLEDLFVNRGTGGLNDYWIAASLGAINLDGSEVFDWRMINETQAAYVAARPTRWDKIRGAIEAFGLAASDYAGFVAIFNTSVGDSGASGGVLAGPTDVNVTFLAHETGHLLGLNHSFDQSDRKDATWSAPGEYFDTYDIMSAMNVSNFIDPRFDQSGPLLCTANQDLMGWLPAARVWTPPSHQSSVTDIDLVSLGHPEVPGYLAARAGGYYIEFRTNDGWDAGLGQPCVLVHRLVGPNAVVIAQDKTSFVNEWQPGQTLGPSDLEMALTGGTRITIVSFDVANRTARIRVQNQVAKPIVAGPAIDVFGSVGVDGGGLVIVGGTVVKIPPHSPVLEMVTRLAMVSLAEQTAGADVQGPTAKAALREVEQLAKQARQR